MAAAERAGRSLPRPPTPPSAAAAGGEVFFSAASSSASSSSPWRRQAAPAAAAAAEPLLLLPSAGPAARSSGDAPAQAASFVGAPAEVARRDGAAAAAAPSDVVAAHTAAAAAKYLDKYLKTAAAAAIGRDASRGGGGPRVAAAAEKEQQSTAAAPGDGGEGKKPTCGEEAEEKQQQQKAEYLLRALLRLQSVVDAKVAVAFARLDEEMEQLHASAPGCLQTAAALSQQLQQLQLKLGTALSAVSFSSHSRQGEEALLRLQALEHLRMHFSRCRRLLVDLHQWEFRVREIELLLHAYQEWQSSASSFSSAAAAAGAARAAAAAPSSTPSQVAAAVFSSPPPSSRRERDPPAAGLLQQRNGRSSSRRRRGQTVSSLCEAAAHAAALEGAVDVLRGFPQFAGRVRAAELLQRRILASARTLITQGLLLFATARLPNGGDETAAEEEQQRPWEDGEELLQVAAGVYVHLRRTDTLLQQELPRCWQQPLLLRWEGRISAAAEEPLQQHGTETEHEAWHQQQQQHFSKRATGAGLAAAAASVGSSLAAEAEAEAAASSGAAEQPHQKLGTRDNKGANELGDWETVLTYCEESISFLEKRAFRLKLFGGALAQAEQQQRIAAAAGSSSSESSCGSTADGTSSSPSSEPSREPCGSQEDEKRQLRVKWEKQLLLAVVRAGAAVPAAALEKLLSARCSKPLRATRRKLPLPPSPDAAAAAGPAGGAAAGKEERRRRTAAEAEKPGEEQGAGGGGAAAAGGTRTTAAERNTSSAAALALKRDAHAAASQTHTAKEEEVKQPQQPNGQRQEQNKYKLLQYLQGKQQWGAQLALLNADDFAAARQVLERCEGALQTWRMLLTLVAATPSVAEQEGAAASSFLQQLAEGEFFFPFALLQHACVAVYVHLVLAAVREAPPLLPFSQRLPPSQVVLQLEARVEDALQRLLHDAEALLQQQRGCCFAAFAPHIVAAADGAAAIFFASLRPLLTTFERTIDLEASQLHELQLGQLREQHRRREGRSSSSSKEEEEEARAQQQQPGEETTRLPSAVPFSLPLLNSCVQLRAVYLRFAAALQHLAASLSGTAAAVFARRSLFDTFTKVVVQLRPEVVEITELQGRTAAPATISVLLEQLQQEEEARERGRGPEADAAISSSSSSSSAPTARLLLPRTWGVYTLQLRASTNLVVRCCTSHAERFLAAFYPAVLLLRSCSNESPAAGEGPASAASSSPRPPATCSGGCGATAAAVEPRAAATGLAATVTSDGSVAAASPLQQQQQQTLPSAPVTLVAELVLQLLPHLDEASSFPQQQTRAIAGGSVIEEVVKGLAAAYAAAVLQAACPVAAAAGDGAAGAVAATGTSRQQQQQRDVERNFSQGTRPRQEAAAAAAGETQGDRREALLLLQRPVLLQLHADLSYLCSLSGSIGVDASPAGVSAEVLLLCGQEEGGDLAEAAPGAARRAAATGAADGRGEGEVVEGRGAAAQARGPQEEKQQHEKEEKEEIEFAKHGEAAGTPLAASAASRVAGAAAEEEETGREFSRRDAQAEPEGSGGWLLGLLLLAVEAALFYREEEEAEEKEKHEADTERQATTEEECAGLAAADREAGSSSRGRRTGGTGEEEAAAKKRLREVLLEYVRAARVKWQQQLQQLQEQQQQEEEESEEAQASQRADGKGEEGAAVRDAAAAMDKPLPTHAMPVWREREAEAVAAAEREQKIWLLVEKLLQ